MNTQYATNRSVSVTCLVRYLSCVEFLLWFFYTVSSVLRLISFLWVEFSYFRKSKKNATQSYKLISYEYCFIIIYSLYSVKSQLFTALFNLFNSFEDFKSIIFDFLTRARKQQKTMRKVPNWKCMQTSVLWSPKAHAQWNLIIWVLPWICSYYLNE